MYIPKGTPNKEETTMKYTIEAIENAKPGMKWDEIGRSFPTAGSWE